MEIFEKFTVIVLLLSVLIIAQHVVHPTFPTGKERHYNLVNDVRQLDHKGGSPSAYRLTGSLRVGSVWGGDELKLLQFHLLNAQLHVPAPAKTDSDNTNHNADADATFDFHTQASHLDTAVNRPFYAVWELGHIRKVYIHGKEDVSLVNLKKALAALFQYQLLDGEYAETDVAGACTVQYATNAATAFEKVWRRCADAEADVQHSRLDGPLAVRVASDRRADYRVTEEGTLEKVRVYETHEYVLQANAKAGAALRSTLSLAFDGSISNIEVFAGAQTAEEAVKRVKGLKKQPLQTDVAVPHGRKEEIPFKNAAVNYKAALADDQVGTHVAALALLQLVQSARPVDSAGFLKVLKAHTMQPLQAQLIDVLAAVQTVEAHEAVKRTLRFTSADDQTLTERYLQGLAVGTRPASAVIEDLLRLAQTGADDFEEANVRDTLIQTVAAMCRRHAVLRQADQRLVKRVHAFILESLEACSATDAACKELFLRALNNLQSAKTVDVLLAHLDDRERRVAVAAAAALRRFPAATWTPKHLQRFRQVFYQQRRRYDSSVRTQALDVLLAVDLSDNEIGELLATLRAPADSQYEVRKYLLQRLWLLAERCERFARRLRAIVVSDPLLNNYDVLAQRGMTTALARRYARGPSFNGTILSVQELYKGVLRRGIVDMSVDAGGEEYSVFTLGLYAGGLSSFVSSDSNANSDADEDGDSNAVDEEPANAGMEITVQGAHFRPLQFFGSQGELMGHAWSGTASEPTAAYRATTLLHDHHGVVRLLNGAAISVRVQGAVSIDLNGQVQFSLWNRNAHCQVDQNAGVAIEGVLALETSFVNLKTVSTITKEPRLVVLSDIEFSGAPKLCIQLNQLETVLKHEIEKTTKVHGTNVLRSNTRSHTYIVPGVTHALNRKNNEMCSNILAD